MCIYCNVVLSLQLMIRTCNKMHTCNAKAMLLALVLDRKKVKYQYSSSYPNLQYCTIHNKYENLTYDLSMHSIQLLQELSTKTE